VGQRTPSSVSKTTFSRTRFPFFFFIGPGLDGDDLVLEFSGLDGLIGPVVALDAELVLIFPRDVVVRGHVLRGDSHGDVGVGPVAPVGMGPENASAHGDVAHGLASAGDDDIGPSRPDLGRGVGDGLQPRGAEAVDRHPGGCEGQSGSQGEDAAEVHPLFRFREGASHDEIIHVFRFQLGNSRHESLHHLNADFIRPGRAEASSPVPSAWTSYRFNNNSITHDMPPYQN